MKRQTSNTNRRYQQRRGATIAEFAIVASVFFLLLFTGIEFSVLNTIRSTANNAAYEGAGKLVIPGASAATGIIEAERIMAIIGVRDLTVTVTPTTLTDETREVTVHVFVPYDSNAFIMP